MSHTDQSFSPDKRRLMADLPHHKTSLPARQFPSDPRYDNFESLGIFAESPQGEFPNLNLAPKTIVEEHSKTVIPKNLDNFEIQGFSDNTNTSK